MISKFSTWLKAADGVRDRASGHRFPDRGQYLRAMGHFWWVDHAWLRSFWWNLHEIAPGVWRSNQPSPRRLRRYREMGIRTVLNLRGNKRNSFHILERAACEKLGLKLVDRQLWARRLPPRAAVLELLDTFATLEKPFVMHCKSGADRAGLASALYLMHVEGVPVREAQRQLSLRYIHVRAFQTGILGHMLDTYEADTKDEPMPIRAWIEQRYDDRRLTAEFDRRRGRG